MHSYCAPQPGGVMVELGLSDFTWHSRVRSAVASNTDIKGSAVLSSLSLALRTHAHKGWGLTGGFPVGIMIMV